MSTSAISDSAKQTGRNLRLSPLAKLSGKKVVTVSVAELKAGLQGLSPKDECSASERDCWTQCEDQITLLLEALQPTPPSPVLPEKLLGCWSDSCGNTVVVQSAGEGLSQLVATLSSATKPDINLSLWPTPDGNSWYCGEAKLDLSKTSDTKVVWVFPHGRVSVWRWQAFTLEAMAIRGLSSSHQCAGDYCVPNGFMHRSISTAGHGRGPLASGLEADF